MPSKAPDQPVIPGPGDIWFHLQASPAPAARPCLFLDRDGVINEDSGYPGHPDDIVPIPGAVPLMQAARAQGFALVVVTNQAGVGRGYFSPADYRLVREHINDLLAVDGVSPDAVLACPWHGDGKGAFRFADHPWRKPAPGMLLAAIEALNLDPARSLIIGDSAGDLQAGFRAGLAAGVHVLTGHGKEQRDRALSAGFGKEALWLVDEPGQAIPALEAVSRL